MRLKKQKNKLRKLWLKLYVCVYHTDLILSARRRYSAFTPNQFKVHLCETCKHNKSAHLKALNVLFGSINRNFTQPIEINDIHHDKNSRNFTNTYPADRVIACSIYQVGLFLCVLSYSSANSTAYFNGTKPMNCFLPLERT
jgi:hypothetical protein